MLLTQKAAGRTAVGQLPSSMSSVSEVCSNVNTTASMSEDDDKPSLSTDPTVPPAANSDHERMNTEARKLVVEVLLTQLRRTLPNLKRSTESHDK